VISREWSIVNSESVRVFGPQVGENYFLGW